MARALDVRESGTVRLRAVAEVARGKTNALGYRRPTRDHFRERAYRVT